MAVRRHIRIISEKLLQVPDSAVILPRAYLEMSKIRTDSSRDLEIARDAAVEQCAYLEMSKRRIEARRSY
jgi:hypothetical protein